MANSNPVGRITSALVIVVLSVCFGNNFQKYSLSATSNLIHLGQRFMNDSSHKHYGIHISDYAMNLLWSFTSAALQLGAVIGSMVTHVLADRYGRRQGLMILAVVTAIGSAMGGIAKLANSLELFIGGRFLIGLASGASVPLGGMFLSEIAPVQYRGACGTVQQLFMGLGVLAAFVFTLSDVWGNEEGWPMAVSVPPFVAAAVQFLVLLCFAHESPRELVLTRNDSVRGLAALKFYQGKAEVDKALMAVKNEQRVLQKGNEENFKFLDLFRKRELRRPLAIALLIIFSCQATGGTAVYAYGTTMFSQAGLSQSSSQYSSMGLGMCTVLTSVATVWLVEKAGRKPLLLSGLLLCDLTLIALTVCLYGGNQYNWPNASIAAIPCLYVFEIGNALSSSVRLVAPAELFPQKARAPAMSVIYTLFCALQCLVAFGYLPVASLIGASYSYMPFIVCITLSIILLFVFMPETKGKTVEQVASIFRFNTALDNV